MMNLGAKQSSTVRKPRRVLPSAERRLRGAFPEVWAWYELLVAARTAAPLDRGDDEEMVLRRSSARR